MRRGGAAAFSAELGGPNVDRCWLVSLAYAGGDLGRVAYREIGGAFTCGERLARVARKCYNVPTESTSDAANVVALLH